MSTTTGRLEVIDLNTPEGIIAHFKTLPSANLHNIAARPCYDAASTVMVMTAAMELAFRGEVA